MPVFGALDHERQLARVPRVEDLAAEAALCQSVEIIVFAVEIPQEDGIAALPQALNPVTPPHVRFELRRHNDSPWGPFNTATLTIACRANGEAFVYAAGGFCDNDRVIDHLRLHYGARLKRGAINVERRYFGVEGRVASEGRLVLDALVERPEAIDAAALDMPPRLNLAKFEGQLWLIEEESKLDVASTERGLTLLRSCDVSLFGEERIRLHHPLPALFVKTALSYQPVSKLIEPGQPASLGMRAVKPHA